MRKLCDQEILHYIQNDSTVRGTLGGIATQDYEEHPSEY
jgi:hypothetical protein